MVKSKANKKTTSTINRRVRHILKRESDKLLETQKPVGDNLPTNFRISSQSKKGGIKYEEKPTLRELKVDQKVKNWREKQVVKNILKKETENLRACRKCRGWSGNDICHCDCVQKLPNQTLVEEVSRRLGNGQLKLEIKKTKTLKNKR